MTLRFVSLQMTKKNVGSGTYSALLPYYDNKVIDKTKLIRYANYESSYQKKLDHSIENYQWFIEFCTFIIVTAILMHTDCHLIKDTDKQKKCIYKYQNIFQNDHTDSSHDTKNASDYFLNYHSFMAKIDAPFINPCKKIIM
jgi:hypothetical protein